MERDNHHILHYRREWDVRPEGQKIRATPSLIPRMERSVHNELHRECPPVPALGYHALQRVAHDFIPKGDTREDIDRLILSIERAGNHPKTHAIERDMGQLTIQAIEMQKPFLEFGMVLGGESRKRVIV